MSQTKIEWTDRVWNPITGCSPVSEGCQNCYAKRMANRLRGRYGYPKDDPFRVTFHPKRLNEPLRWRKSQKVFVCSMGDLFHEKVERQWIDQVMAEILYDYEHTFLILTKRPTAAQFYFMDFYRTCKDSILPNLWLGVSISNQPDADKNIPILLQIPAVKRFVSVEPMLGPVNIPPKALCPCSCFAGNTRRPHPDCEGKPSIDWVICGGETGPRARPMYPDWVRSLRNQCQLAGAPFFFKHWGEYKEFIYAPTGEKELLRVGKERAGHLLDGKEYREFPK